MLLRRLWRVVLLRPLRFALMLPILLRLRLFPRKKIRMFRFGRVLLIALLFRVLVVRLMLLLFWRWFVLGVSRRGRPRLRWGGWVFGMGMLRSCFCRLALLPLSTVIL